LKTSTDLISKMRWELTAFAKGDDRKEVRRTAHEPGRLWSPKKLDVIMEHAFDRYFKTRACSDLRPPAWLRSKN
jgi:hypothetical protein